MKKLCLLIFYFIPMLALADYDGWRDPTKPADYVENTKQTVRKELHGTGLKLNSIMVSKKRRLATINDQVLTEGDAVSGFEVVAIHPDYVILSGEQGTFTLHLFQDVTGKPPGKYK